MADKDNVVSDTTRRFPRTLQEAFPSGTEYACAIERARKRSEIVDGALIVGGCLLAVAVVTAWLS